MADDPRVRPAAEAMEYAAMRYLGTVHRDLIAATGLTAADAHDPLRALLADEDRAVELFRSRGLTKNQAWRVLAALREVAGP